MAAASLKDKDVGKTFGIGCAVSCFVDEREVCSGYVTAFDNYYKTLAIQSPQSDKINLINLSNVTVKLVSSDKPKYIGGKQKVDLTKVEQKYQEAVKKRMEELSRIGDGVTAEAQHLFDRIYSVYNQTVWDGSTIVVMKDVRISPPYKTENCTGSSADALERIQKLVTRFNSDKNSSKPAT